MVNGWKTILLIYFGGAFVFDMVDYFGGVGITGCGASGAVLALNAAYLATVILVRKIHSILFHSNPKIGRCTNNND